MPPRVGSRYSFTLGVRDLSACNAQAGAAGVLHLTEREPYRFRAHADNRVHVVVQGDTLFDLAGRYFAPLPRACGFWWAIADFGRPPGASNQQSAFSNQRSVFRDTTHPTAYLLALLSADG